jgi:hypothetical protein
MAGWTQGAIETFLKADIQGSPSWNEASDIFFNIILGGFQTLADFLFELAAAFGVPGSTIADIQTFFSDRWNDILSLFDFIQEIIDNVWSGFTGIFTSGNPLTSIFDAISGLFGIGTNAQTSANTANIGVAHLNAQLAAIGAPPGGVVLNDNFDRTGSDMGANWMWNYFGPGAGALAPDGNNSHWSANGATWRGIDLHHVTPLNTDTQMCSIVADAPGDATNEDPELRLRLRCDTTFNNCVVSRIWTNTVEIGHVVSGTYTRLGSPASHGAGPGARWEMWAGTAADERQFKLFVDDTLVCDQTDAADVSQMGASFRQPGYSQIAGVQFFGFFFAQAAPTDVQGWAAADHAAL